MNNLSRRFRDPASEQSLRRKPARLNSAPSLTTALATPIRQTMHVVSKEFARSQIGHRSPERSRRLLRSQVLPLLPASLGELFSPKPKRNRGALLDLR